MLLTGQMVNIGSMKKTKMASVKTTNRQNRRTRLKQNIKKNLVFAKLCYHQNMSCTYVGSAVSVCICEDVVCVIRKGCISSLCSSHD